MTTGWTWIDDAEEARAEAAGARGRRDLGFAARTRLAAALAADAMMGDAAYLDDLAGSTGHPRLADELAWPPRDDVDW